MKKIIILLFILCVFNSCGLFFPAGVWGDLNPYISWEEYSPGPGKIAVGYDIENTIDIESMGLIPFLIGELPAFIPGTGTWDVTGLLPDGSGPQVLNRMSDRIYYIEFSIPSANYFTSIFKIANFNVNYYTQVTNDIWSSIGLQSASPAQAIIISNYILLKVVNPQTVITNNNGDSGNGLVVEDNKVLINLGANGGWTAGLTP